MWELGHRTREASESVAATIEAETSAEAIGQLRAQIPAEHAILFIRAMDRPPPLDAA